MALSVYLEDLPDLSLSLDIDGYDSTYDDYASTDRTLGFKTGLDFSKFLPKTGGDYEPYLKLNYYGLHSMVDDSDTGSSIDLGHAVTLTLGLQF